MNDFTDDYNDRPLEPQPGDLTGIIKSLFPFCGSRLQAVEKPMDKTQNWRWRGNYEETGGDQKFRVQPFLKGWQEWRGQSPFPGTPFPYFRNSP